MIVGHGDIASVLPNRDDLLFFASGVSNSQETRDQEYHRERHLLLDQPRERHIVYFSSLAIFYSNTRYARHKRQMEQLIKDTFFHWTIIRLGNILWGNNPHTIINFFRNKIKNNEKFEVKDEYRYIIDKEEFLHWINMIPSWNCEMNLTGTRMKVNDIVREYCYEYKLEYGHA
jgi:hypothetical protein